MNKVISGLFDDGKSTSLALSRLKQLGVKSSDIVLVAGEDGVLNQPSANDQNYAHHDEPLEEILDRCAKVGYPLDSDSYLLVTGSLLIKLAEQGAGATPGGLTYAVVKDIVAEADAQLYLSAVEKGSVIICVNYSAHDRTTLENALTHAGALTLSERI